MSALPTTTELLLERHDLQDFLPQDKTLGDYLNRALAEVRRSLEDLRGISWDQVFDSDADDYLDNADSTGRNSDRLKHAIKLKAISLVFKDKAINANDGGKFWSLYEEYRNDYDLLLDTARIDVDLDGDGSIDEGEELNTTQTFLSR